MTAPHLRNSAPHVVLIVLLLAAALMRFWRSPQDAGGRLVTPDGAEYAVSAHRLATLGTLDIDVGGVRYPIRYPPMFSVVLLAPVYFVAPDEIGNGILLVLGFALLMVGAAYVVGFRLAGLWGAALAAVAVIHHKLLADSARTIMTDAPVAALFVVGLALFLRMRRDSSAAVWLLAGMTCAFAAGMRPLAAVMWLPFIGLLVAQRHRLAPKLAALLAPGIVLFVAIAWYNHARFGVWNRTGYQLWAPIPYEWLGLTFSPRYFFGNATVLFQPVVGLTILAGAIGISVLFLRKMATAARAVAFVAAGALPISAAHLYYFHLEPRFHAPLLAPCAVLAAGGLATLLPRRVKGWPWLAVGLVAISLVVTRPPRDAFDSIRPIVAKLAAHVPQGGTIITRLTPVELDPPLLRPGGRQWLPVWRHQEYSGKAIAPRPIDLPADAVMWPGPHRQAVLFEAGAEEAVAWTATERPDLVAERIRAGPGVFLDAETVPPGSEPYKRLAREFGLTPAAPDGAVLKLSLRSNQTDAKE